MSLPFREETYTVSSLCGELRDFLQQAFPAVWVAGEINRLRQSRRGHLYFELVEKGEGDQIVAKLEAVIWQGDLRRVRTQLADSGQELSEGMEIRCRGGVDFYGPFGRLQLVVREVDPVFTLGMLARRRRETLEALSAAGLLERNRLLPLPTLPLRLALITSEGSAAYHDFLSTLAQSGYPFRVLFIHSSVQGRQAEREVATALQTLSGLPVDCAALIRGGGSRADLAVFDSRAIAEAVARAPVPVFTGLGHEIDRSIADLTAHSAFNTPTAVAKFLVERVSLAEQRLAELRRALEREALAPLRRARESLGRAEAELVRSRRRVERAGARLREVGLRLERSATALVRRERSRASELSGRLGSVAPRQLARRRLEPERAALRLVARSRGRLREAAATLAGWQRLCAELSPRRTLERGFSVTRREDGRIVRDAAGVAAGDRIRTELAEGELTSRVEG